MTYGRMNASMLFEQKKNMTIWWDLGVFHRLELVYNYDDDLDTHYLERIFFPDFPNFFSMAVRFHYLSSCLFECESSLSWVFDCLSSVCPGF